MCLLMTKLQRKRQKDTVNYFTPQHVVTGGLKEKTSKVKTHNNQEKKGVVGG